MWKKKALGIGITASGLFFSGSTLACQSPSTTTISSCYEFPDVKESLIINRNGDQTNLKANESYRMTYAYREKEVVRQNIQNAEGKSEVAQYDRVNNQSVEFHGDSVAAVKRLAENFVASRQPWVCKR